MPVTVKYKFTSQVFKTDVMRQEASSFIGRQGKDFKNLSQRRMIESQPAGRLYKRKRGQGFTRSHRASARGQRPAIDTGKLLNSVNDRRLGPYKVKVSVDTPYAPILQSPKLDRKIIRDSDIVEAQAKIVREGNMLARRWAK